MKILYENGKFIYGTEYNCDDDTDMKVFVDTINTQFAKIEEENIVLKHKLRAIASLVNQYE